MRWRQQDFSRRARALIPARWRESTTLGDERLWVATETSVAHGVAIGIFFGLLLPVGQIVAAVAMAAVARANLSAAILATFITNPFTMPLVYASGYWVGRSILAVPALQGTWSGGDDAMTAVGCLALGQALVASAGAVAGLGLTRVAWRAIRGR